MDVILWLANSGAPLTELDQKNHSPSFNAVSAWDPEERFIKERFTDGAILIGTLFFGVAFSKGASSRLIRERELSNMWPGIIGGY